MSNQHSWLVTLMPLNSKKTVLKEYVISDMKNKSSDTLCRSETLLSV